MNALRPSYPPVPPAARKALVVLGPPLVAAALAGISVLVGWHGKDLAAQTYRVHEVRAHGLLLWDIYWYGGNYPLSYSVLMPVIAAFIGLTATGIAFAALAAWAFDRLVTGWWGRRPAGSWYFAASTVLLVAIGQLPYLTGEAFALAAVLALRRRRRALAGVLVAACALCSGVAATFLVLALVAWALHQRAQRWWLVAMAGVPIVLLGAIFLIFPGTGSFPYGWGGAAWSLGLCVAAFTPLFRSLPVVRTAAALYAVLVVGALVIPSPMGGNANRLGEGVGTALLICVAWDRIRETWRDRRLQLSPRRNLAVLGAVTSLGFVVWAWAPGTGVVSASSSPANQASFYQPLLSQLASRSTEPVRIEVPPTVNLWESAYLAPHVSLARGWERQLDIANNPIFYDKDALTPSSYRAWLLDNGISFVALPHAPLDYAAKGEAALLDSDRVPGLQFLWASPDWTLWQVVGSPGLVSGPAVLDKLQGDQVVVNVQRPGALTLRVRYTPYWSVADNDGCVRETPAHWTQIDANRPGPLQLTTSLLNNSTC
jgi:hypothetical protein